MTPEDFIKKYEQALKSQDWSQVAPLFHEKACVTFSSGVVHEGKAEVKKAFEKNFSTIKNEEYKISKVRWILETETMAAYLFHFDWEGIVQGKQVAGHGIGTSILIRENEQWLLLTENLHKPTST